jgi:predicted DNA-binding protein (MmcQ/YjbR family)
MDAETARAFLLKLPRVVETQQWGDNLLFWVGDKAIGGKMFCVMNLDADGHGVMSYSAGPERFSELLERDGLKPAPYMARNHWVAVDSWAALRNAEWQAELRAAYDIIFARLPQRTRAALALPATARDKLVRERKKLLADRALATPVKPRRK